MGEVYQIVGVSDPGIKEVLKCSSVTFYVRHDKMSREGGSHSVSSVFMKS